MDVAVNNRRVTRPASIRYSITPMPHSATAVGAIAAASPGWRCPRVAALAANAWVPTTHRNQLPFTSGVIGLGCGPSISAPGIA